MTVLLGALTHLRAVLVRSTRCPTVKDRAYSNSLVVGRGGGRLFLTTCFAVAFADQDSVQMLQRSTQIGEFYRMTPPAVFNPKEALPPTYMDIMIFDEESDRHVHITFEQALYASTFGSPDLTYDVFKWGEDLKPADEQRMTASADRSGYTSAQALANWKAVSDVYKKKIPNPTETKAAMQTLINLVKNGVWIPIELVICRPFIEHLMLSAVVAVAGRDTGATLFGPADMCATWKSHPMSSRPYRPQNLTLHTRLSSQADLGQHVRQDDRGCVANTQNTAHCD